MLLKCLRHACRTCRALTIFSYFSLTDVKCHKLSNFSHVKQKCKNLDLPAQSSSLPQRTEQIPPIIRGHSCRGESNNDLKYSTQYSLFQTSVVVPMNVPRKALTYPLSRVTSFSKSGHFIREPRRKMDVECDKVQQLLPEYSSILEQQKGYCLSGTFMNTATGSIDHSYGCSCHIGHPQVRLTYRIEHFKPLL